MMKLQQSESEPEQHHVYIHKSVLSEILLRVSARTLLRFKCVCKEWRSLIEDPHFVENHFDHGERNHSMIGLAIASYAEIESNGKISLSLFERGREERPRWNRVQDHEDPLTKIVGHKGNDHSISMLECKGLICFSHEDIQIICNPITKECVTLPLKTRDDAHTTAARWAFGFGYSLGKKRYMVVELVRGFNSEHDKFITSLNVFTLGGTSKSWRTTSLAEHMAFIDGEDRECIEFIERDSTYVNGSIYWYIEPPTSSNHLLCFDLESERLRLINAPENFIFNGWYNIGKTNNDVPCFLKFDYHQLSLSGIIKLSIWTLKNDPCTNQDLWIKDYAIDLSPPATKGSTPIPFFAFHNGRLYSFDDAGLVSYGLDDGKIDHVAAYTRQGIGTSKVFPDVLDLLVYKESLFSLVSWGLKVNYFV